MEISSYILITAAYNEAKLIENTIISVISQTLLPRLWVIVSDGSTDGTDEIVKKYQDKFSFIKLISRKKKNGRDFSSKVSALHIGLESVNIKEYGYIGILDADVTFLQNYYKSLINEFFNDKCLGIAGGTYYDIEGDKKEKILLSKFSVRGATQFFRRECFEQIGGMVPLKYGGEDAVACFAARMYGWEVKNFPYLEVLHHRLTGTADRNIFSKRFRDGFVEYHLGYHPLFQFIKCFSRIKEKPIVLGSILRFSGFWWAYLRRDKRIISGKIIRYIRKEQMHRLLNADT